MNSNIKRNKRYIYICMMEYIFVDVFVRFCVLKLFVPFIKSF